MARIGVRLALCGRPTDEWLKVAKEAKFDLGSGFGPVHREPLITGQKLSRGRLSFDWQT
jgi:hypothetical protein